ncbi:TetR/AcrR family transcriptional regulator [Mycolicibacterium pyrenivorans]|uniref:TetR/AcrR family transcriptional regulator n=1 Tax=Mycolicibacterium pyrenivorans TaxID=187102 RepID=UPI0021F2C2AC|nr:TetR/AcrR family transcriptional regulator [Mycolicibacterium pyrenivorans]MCV7151541.1 TetR/AcrR family transcriptional regulator [Mycolicibacterium pyrenivorans]
MSSAKRPRRRAAGSSEDVTRRTEIVQAANRLIAHHGLGTSLQQIADASGILVGSLYHHFKSKDALLDELNRRYRADLDLVGQAAMARLEEASSPQVGEQIHFLCREIARCAVKHQAALQMSFLEGRTKRSDSQEQGNRPSGVETAMLRLLREGRRTGFIRPDVDLAVVADRVCQSVLHAGLAVVRHGAPTDDVAEVLCGIHLLGLTAADPTNDHLDRSPALAVADAVVKSWAGENEAVDDTASRVRIAARKEFSRRGFEVTTIRDIAAASGLPPGTVYRHLGSKDEMLKSIMLSITQKIGDAWADIMRTDSSPTEKLDALCWLNINAVDRFPEEFAIQLAWMRHAPPEVAEPLWSFDTRRSEMSELIAAGIETGDLVVPTHNMEILTRCVIGILWIPPNIVRELGSRASLIHSRDTVLRGLAVRGP